MKLGESHPPRSEYKGHRCPRHKLPPGLRGVVADATADDSAPFRLRRDVSGSRDVRAPPVRGAATRRPLPLVRGVILGPMALWWGKFTYVVGIMMDFPSDRAEKMKAGNLNYGSLCWTYGITCGRIIETNEDEWEKRGAAPGSIAKFIYN